MNKNIFEYLKYRRILKKENHNSDPKSNISNQLRQQLTTNLLDNMMAIRQKLDGTNDMNVREIEVGGIKTCILTGESMVDLSEIQLSMISLVKTFEGQSETKPYQIYQFIEQKMLFSVEMSDAYHIDDVINMMMSGFMLILIDGLSKAIVLGAQGFQFRSISEPSGEVNVRGSREGFTEPIKINMTMIRRRIKSEKLKFETLTLGKDSNTLITLAYMKDVVSKKMLRGIRYKLSQIQSNIILNSGNLHPFLDSSNGSFFSGVGYTERPDTLCYKINEGRVGVLVDGTPFALVVPYIFCENFQSIDDVDQKPYYASMVRLLKYTAFIISILFPGIYVAIGMFHPELFPPALLLNIVSAQESTPFSMLTQALFFQFVYELMREAGLRLPRPIGHTISIIGSLIVGETAVASGLVAAPMVMVIAITAIASYVVPSLQESGTALRFLFILAGGYAGLFGVSILGIIVVLNASALTTFGVPYLSPISPFHAYSIRDSILRFGHKKMQQKHAKLENLTGVHLNRD